MEIEQVAELARAIAALPQGHQDFFNGLVANERAKAAEVARIAKLRAMSDDEIVLEVLEECTERAADLDADAALKMLREAGFVRLTGPVLNAADENRWEVGLRNIVTILRGPCVPFDIPDIVEEVRVLAEGKRPDLQAAYRLGFKSSDNAFNGQTSYPNGERFRNKMDEDLRTLEASQ